MDVYMLYNKIFIERLHCNISIQDFESQSVYTVFYHVVYFKSSMLIVIPIGIIFFGDLCSYCQHS